MGGVGEVIEAEDDGNVRCDMGGGDLVTADGFAGAGSDCPPLPGDDVAVTEGVGSGAHQVAGYHDATAKKAAPGEKRIYARDSSGAVVAEIHLKSDGIIHLGDSDAANTLVMGDELVATLNKIKAWIDAVDGVINSAPPVLEPGNGSASALQAALALALAGDPMADPPEPIEPPSDTDIEAVKSKHRIDE